jgi:hypothetical protein
VSRLLLIPAILISAMVSPEPWNMPLIAAERGEDEADIGDGRGRTHAGWRSILKWKCEGCCWSRR